MSATAALVEELRANNFANEQVYDMTVPENVEPPFIWLGRRGQTSWGLLEPDSQPFITYVDVECVDYTPTAALALADSVREYLAEVPPSTFGQGTIQAVNVDDQDDGYVIRNAAADERMIVGALDVAMINYQEAEDG